MSFYRGLCGVHERAERELRYDRLVLKRRAHRRFRVRQEHGDLHRGKLFAHRFRVQLHGGNLLKVVSAELFKSDTLKSGTKKLDLVMVMCEYCSAEVEWLIDN